MKTIIKCLERYCSRRKIQREYALDKFLDFLIDLFDVSHFYKKGGFEAYTKEAAAKEPELMAACIEWMNMTGEMIETGGWYDSLGHIYEEMYQSKGKASALGQFYTPDALCDLMARVTESNDGEIRLNDCACGSGRTMLAAFAQSKFKKAYYIAGDIDAMSVKMCTLNFMVHGMRGQVRCQDALNSPVYFDWGYEINEVRYPFPTIYYSVRRISYPEPEKEQIIEHKEKVKKAQQLSLF